MSLGIKPRYHLTCPNWMNDPIPFWDSGVWHLFFQHNPYAPKWDTMHWGHATSTDLVEWKLHPIAIYPSEPYELPGGIWTGSIVRRGPVFYAFYTAVSSLNPLVQNQSLATSADLHNWTKHPGNPRIPSPPEGYGPCWRDPQVFWQDGIWKMIIGSEIEGFGGALLLYESQDLIDWTYIGESFRSPLTETGIDFECPDLFPLGDRWVLITSRGAVHWFVGQWDGRTFTSERRGTCDGIPFSSGTPNPSPYYAAKSCLAPDGRRLLFAWIQENQINPRQHWNGAQALPRELFLLPDGDLGMRPARELNRLRESHLRSEPFFVPMNESKAIPGWSGVFSEFTFRVDGESPFTLSVRSDEKGNGMKIPYDARERTLGGVKVGWGPINVRVFLDGSIVAVFANDRVCLTYRISSPEDQEKAFIYAHESPVYVDWLHTWRPKGSSETPLRTDASELK